MPKFPINSTPTFLLFFISIDRAANPQLIISLMFNYDESFHHLQSVKLRPIQALKSRSHHINMPCRISC